MSRYSVEITGVNTANIKILTNTRMRELFLELDTNPNAREELVNGNLRLVLSILKKYNGRTENMDDLFQVGVIGLLKAIDNFCLSHNVRFSTYAVPMILGEVKRFLRDNKNIRIARSLKDQAYRVALTQEKLRNQLNHEPTIDEIANELEITRWQVIEAIESMGELISLDEPISNHKDDVTFLGDQIADKKGSSNWDLRYALKKALSELKQREKLIIESRYLIGKTQTELAKELNISQAQVSRIEKIALKTLKKKMQ